MKAAKDNCQILKFPESAIKHPLPYRMGFNAFYKGIAYIFNPYNPIFAHDEYTEWFAGWLTAQQEANNAS